MDMVLPNNGAAAYAKAPRWMAYNTPGFVVLITKQEMV
jgi:hypothetical protein